MRLVKQSAIRDSTELAEVNPRSAMRSGFTLVELLVVIGIIILLIGILLPVVKGVKTSAYNAAAAQQIARLTSAIEAYSQEFGAYPGPLSNDQVITGAPLPTAKSSGGGGGGGAALTRVTMSENLVLGLIGGLEPGTTPVGVYNEDRVRNRMGAMSLNPAAPKGYKVFFEASAGELSLESGLQVPSTKNFRSDQGGPAAADSQIPEILDTFPDRLPVLYLRARKGAPGVISNNNQPAKYQYDLRQIDSYTAPRATTGTPPFGIGGTGPHGLAQLGNPVRMKDLKPPEAPWTGNPLASQPDTGTNTGAPAYGAISYFMSSQLNTTGTPANATATPRQKDTYILISAGKDRVYGTRDDITNFGSLD